mgnify:CR=1 FL=1
MWVCGYEIVGVMYRLRLRRLSKVGRTNLYDQFQIGFDQAEAYRKSVGQYLRKNQWDNVTVEVFI